MTRRRSSAGSPSSGSESAGRAGEPPVIRLALRSLVARRGRTLLSIVGVALGIGVLYASLATDAGISAAIDRTVVDLVGRADLRVEAFGPAGLTPDSLAAVEAAPGVAVAAPVLQRRTYLATTSASGEPAAPVTLLGIDPDREGQVRDLALASGRPLGAADEGAALVTESLARTDGLTTGGTVTLLGPDGPVAVPIAGVLA